MARALVLLLALLAAAVAAGATAVCEGEFVLREFRFASGGVLPA